MSWFDTWLSKKMRKAWDEAGQIQQKITAKEKYALGTGLNIAAAPGTRELDTHPDLNFRMYRAENGYVMEVRQFDKRTDRQHTNLHLIPDSEDLGNSIAHIITVEALKAS